MDKFESMIFIKQFMAEIKEQDNRCTALPYFYVIRSAKWIPSYRDGEGERETYCRKDDYENHFSVTSDEEAIEEYKEANDDDEKILNMCDEEILELIEEEYDRYSEVQTWEEHGCFFTESDAKSHLKLNNYHYSNNAHTYVKHCWRSPQMKKLFESLGTIVDIDIFK